MAEGHPANDFKYGSFPAVSWIAGWASRSWPRKSHWPVVSDSWALLGIVIGLDFYHLGENIHKCRRPVFGEDDAADHKWASDLCHTLKHDGYDAAWESLTTWRATLRSPAKKKHADRLPNYVSDRRDMIDYPEFIKRGWQIGSGPTESRCKTSTSRLKGRGRRWDMPTAESTAALTTLQDSGQWHLYWPIPGLAKI